MSVIKKSKEILGRVGITLLSSEHLRPLLLDAENQMLLAKLESNEHDFIDHEIRCFIERLYLANQLAFLRQYDREAKSYTLKRLEETDISGKLLSMKELWSELKSIRYNLYTNAGVCFLGKEDFETLTSLIDNAIDLVEVGNIE
ncbi:hypothetical protein ES705_33136 [subsurface metagenome]